MVESRGEEAQIAAIVIRGRPQAIRAAKLWLETGELPVRVLAFIVRDADLFTLHITPQRRLRRRRGGDNSGKVKLPPE